MRRQAVLFTVAVVALFSVACQRHESNITGTYGDRVVTGQVVMASEVANHTPAGVEVSVMGTGMSATLAADGRFTFVGVPDNATLAFRRADGIDARLRIGNGSGTLAVEIGPNGAKPSKRRGASPADPGPHQEIEGLVTNVDTTANTLTVHDSHGNDVTVALTDTTLIRKGDKVVKAADLTNGERVHVKAVMVNKTLTATQVIVQDENQTENEMHVSGTVKSNSGGTLVVTTKSGDVTVNTDTNTVVTKDGQKIAVSDINTGDQVSAEGTRVDATTMLAKSIEVRTPEMHVSGTVKSNSGGTLVVTTKNGDITVNTDTNTVVTKNGQTIAVSDINTGDQVSAEGTRVDATTMLAKTIEVEAAETNEEMSVSGTVKSNSGGTLVVTTKHGDVTVNTDASTVVEKNDTTISVADINTGDLVSAEGTKVDATTMLARTIDVHSATTNAMFAAGTVKSSSGGTLVVTTKAGDITVNTDSNTVVYKDGSKISVSDIKTGDQVVAAGTKVDATTMLAKAIQVGSSSGGHD